MTNPKQRIEEALQVLRQLGMPNEQLNDRTAICLLALLNLQPHKLWQQAENPMLGIRAILDFARENLEVNYAENTRESVRKYSVKQLVSAGILVHNPDKPDRPVNSSDNCYQIEATALTLLKKHGTAEWLASLEAYLATRTTLVAQYARERDRHRIPVRVREEQEITLSAGPHSDLIRAIIEDFGSNYVPSGELVYVGDTGVKWGYFDNHLLSELGVHVGQHGKMPDVVMYARERHWLVLVEAVASSGPVDAGRHVELSELFKHSSAGLVYVTAFPDRGEVFRRFLSVVAWETEVWCASDPTHLIHFNGERFLGPYGSP
ncbi:BsuBI/PstI family type II restriction endonuclease [Methylicorpusculum sp.]|uniref:BsuBI/PstI family type II restriction endonuclease n=1 Tax=Methylicorpusculum sp. TaxID=2713644 RepID=UPI002ABA095E|nr:BsuBI/PstI family type II restriction endonuclease [Methylicorpusculum sp.]MDZ4153179.1 BsuBI/PstI family type II restriction endonuclease [Methylicorpusculum sp.]